MQTVDQRQDSSGLAHFYSSPDGMDGIESAVPFRPINLDQIQNSSNGKQFRSPIAAARKQGTTGSGKMMGSFAKTAQ